MRILLDESAPGRLGPLLIGHAVTTVQPRGWSSIQNGKLLALVAGEFDVVLTADKGMEHQQNLAALPVAVLIVLARSNRMQGMVPAVPCILNALGELVPGTLVKVVA